MSVQNDRVSGTSESKSALYEAWSRDPYGAWVVPKELWDKYVAEQQQVEQRRIQEQPQLKKLAQSRTDQWVKQSVPSSGLMQQISAFFS